MLKSLFNWKVLLNILLAIVVFVGLVWLTFRWLDFHTNHGKEIEVPNVINMSAQKAIEVLDNAGVAYQLDSLKFDPKFKPSQVLKVDPLPGSRVKDGRPIKVYINPKTWAKVAIPEVIDTYKYRAFDKLSLVGLKVGDTLYEPSIAKDAVIRLMYNGAQVKPGDLVPRFSVIDVVVGQGPKRNVPVPNIVGRTLQEAKEIIKQNYFENGLFYDEYDQSVSDPSMIVFYQNPAAGSISDQGVQVDLWASKKTPAEMHAKISELDNIYRHNLIPQVDPGETNFDDFDTPPPPRPVKPKPVEKPKADAPKTVVPEKKEATDKKTVTKTEQKPKSEEHKPADKPKEKKKVIIE
ncbi:PASTA domain-containing protein [Elizabethkingia anophelis]|uniref:PASTA domain-containing protein n=1 Tax=Elizabethkingia anophelis TaxID=1117645 RepID=UPI000C9B6445|nr:PASTA domain-containing protein [Elizabethkingia anophelis]MCT3759817.1 PASTA domain-containing protein [Elizabethkingia anophelis]MCT3974476.1 PASTA domain-containing protein [Elizabethkingia anophelis]MCT4002555.1 PASTA domain-containing protein [Elizabethkingia anophelis]MCT4016698.1 PASTA domain-containing protein [Elizabethkingia anophelis]MCT4020136.1 PASTA domain-containing protein [Elizabethkingia anophelis]